MRTRLVAVIAVPLVLLLAVAVPEAAQRRTRAADADRFALASEAVDDVAGVVGALQSERTLSAAARSGARSEVASALDAQRVLTDGAMERAVVALGDLSDSDTGLAEVTRRAEQRLQTLAEVRTESDTAESIVPWTDPFAPIIRDLLAVQDEVGSRVAEQGLGEPLALVTLVARAKDAAARQGAELATIATWGEIRGDQARILADQRADETAYRTAYLAGSPPDRRTERRAELEAGDATVAGRTVDEVAEGAEVSSLNEWLDLSAGRQEVLRGVEGARAAEALAAAHTIEAAARRSSTGYLALAGSGLLLALTLALAAAQSITRPLRELTDAADHLAQERLPKLVDALRHPVDDDEHYLTAALEPIEVRSDDELGHLAHAFNAVQSVAVDVAAEQAKLLKKGISDLYVNLARRNQALLDRQIQLLDQLEQGEQDTEVLEHLYRLDHLATRMRRNAESLLVLAGSESGPRRSKPIELVDVVRAALSEVEEFERVELGSMAIATLHGPAVSDVAHLIAELLENATHFSSPATQVRVDGSRTGGSYQLVISDRGVGIRQEQLDELNTVLRDPPVTGLALGRALGCLVAARLAARHGITVRLRAGEHEGVSAYVILPRHLLVDASAQPLPAPVPDPFVALPADDAWLADWDDALPAVAPVTVELIEPDAAPPVVIERVDPAPTPARLAEALPARGTFEEGLQALLDRESEPTLVEPLVAAPTPQVSADVGGGLRRRIPGATTEARPAPTLAPAVRRSPAEVRALLSRYRSGLQAGRDIDDPTAEERS